MRNRGYEEQGNTISKLQMKVADLEDRSHRNNLKKKRGIPEAVKPQDLIPYLQLLFLKFILDVTPRDLLMDTEHRIPKPLHLPDTVPRDVLTLIHFYHIKEQLLRAGRSSLALSLPYAGIALYQDSKIRKEKMRKEYTPITAILKDNNIVYHWGFPTKLLVTYQSQQTTITAPKDDYRDSHYWGLTPSSLLRNPSNNVTQKS